MKLKSSLKRSMSTTNLQKPKVETTAKSISLQDPLPANPVDSGGEADGKTPKKKQNSTGKQVKRSKSIHVVSTIKSIPLKEPLPANLVDSGVEADSENPKKKRNSTEKQVKRSKSIRVSEMKSKPNLKRSKSASNLQKPTGETTKSTKMDVIFDEEEPCEQTYVAIDIPGV